MSREAVSASSALQRLSPWAGIAFVVLVAVGFTLVTDTPDSTDKQAWVDFYDQRDNRLSQIIGGYLGIFSAFAFLWFGHAFVARLGGRRDGGDLLTSLARSAATLFTAMLILSMLVEIAVSAALEIGDVAVPDTADFGIQFEQLAFGILLVAGCLSASVFIATTTELARQEKMLPTWLIWVGFGAAVVLLFGLLFFPIVVIPLWVLVVAVVLLVQRAAPVADVSVSLS